MRILPVAIPVLCALSLAAPAEGPPPKELAARALMEAAYEGDLKTVRQLVSAGVAADTRDAEKRTPLMWASFNGHTSVAAFLLEQGAEVDCKDASGRTALMYASSGPFPETVKLLLQEGADVNVQGTLEGFTALMTAAAEGQLEVVRLLLVHGANAKLKDVDGDTAESFAEQKGHATVVDLLRHPPPRMGTKD